MSSFLRSVKGQWGTKSRVDIFKEANESFRDAKRAGGHEWNNIVTQGRAGKRSRLAGGYAFGPSTVKQTVESVAGRVLAEPSGPHDDDGHRASPCEQLAQYDPLVAREIIRKTYARESQKEAVELAAREAELSRWQDSKH